jgi:hypothetical protein
MYGRGRHWKGKTLFASFYQNFHHIIFLLPLKHQKEPEAVFLVMFGRFMNELLAT